MNPAGQPHEQTLADYLAVVRRYKWVIIAFAVLAPLAAYFVSAQQAKVYEASAEVLLTRQDLGSAVTGIPNPNTYTDPDRYARTQAALARIPAVATKTVDRAGVSGVTPDQLIGNSSVTPQENADLLRFTVRNGDPGAAVKLATAYAEAFTDHRLQMDTASLARARKELQGRLRELGRQNATDTPLYRSLVQKAQDLRTLELLQDRASVVHEADTAGLVAPTPKRNALLAGLLGLMLGVGVAFLWNSLDQRIRNEDEIERALGLPVLARLPDATRKLRQDRTLAMLSESPSLATEAIRQLRTNVELANIDTNAKSIMVTSAAPFEGKSTTLSNLAVAIARSGRTVALVDLDLRQPTIAQYFRLQGQAGVTDVALGRTSLDRALVHVRLPGDTAIPISGRAPSEPGILRVLPAGTPAPNPGDFVGTQALSTLLEQLEADHDVVLVDAPPLLVVGDAMTLSRNVDALLVVVRKGVADRREVRELARALEACPSHKLGFVLTGAESSDMYGSVSYGRYVTSSDGEPEHEAPPLEDVAQRGRWSAPRVGYGTRAVGEAGRESRRSR
jgi:capsular exopolysaccharide synthesis family protein